MVWSKALRRSPPWSRCRFPCRGTFTSQSYRVSSGRQYESNEGPNSWLIMPVKNKRDLTSDLQYALPFKSVRSVRYLYFFKEMNLYLTRTLTKIDLNYINNVTNFFWTFYSWKIRKTILSGTMFSTLDILRNVPNQHIRKAGDGPVCLCGGIMWYCLLLGELNDCLRSSELPLRDWLQPWGATNPLCIHGNVSVKKEQRSV